MFTEHDLDELIRNIEEKEYRRRLVPFFYSNAYKEYSSLQTDEEKEKWLNDNYLKRWYWDWIIK